MAIAAFDIPDDIPTVHRHPPRMGNDANEILASLGISGSRIGTLRSRKVVA